MAHPADPERSQLQLPLACGEGLSGAWETLGSPTASQFQAFLPQWPEGCLPSAPQSWHSQPYPGASLWLSMPGEWGGQCLAPEYSVSIQKQVVTESTMYQAQVETLDTACERERKGEGIEQSEGVERELMSRGTGIWQPQREARAWVSAGSSRKLLPS